MMTGVGVILGTAAYMSPEQARGKTVDKRADIWAFGCVLYEMLTGRSAFAGETVSDTLAAILEREPDWNALPAATPSAVRRLLRRCLEKDPRRRLHDVADARIEIEDALATPTSGGSAGPGGLARGVIGPASSRASPWTLFWAAATFAMAVAVIALAALALRRPAADLRPLRLSIVPPAGTQARIFVAVSASSCSSCHLPSRPDRTPRRRWHAHSSNYQLRAKKVAGACCWQRSTGCPHRFIPLRASSSTKGSCPQRWGFSCGTLTGIQIRDSGFGIRG